MCAIDALLYLSLFIHIVSITKSQNISTIPDTESGDAYIIANEGEINVTVLCTVFDVSNQVVTPWRIQRQGVDETLRDIGFYPSGLPTINEFIGDLFATGRLIPGFAETFLTNFTFLNFTSQFDTTHLQCGDTATETRNFFFGFPVYPQVRDDINTQFVMEGNDITVNLTVAGAKDSFPPVTNSGWMFNGQNLTSSSTIILNEFSITLTSVQRNLSGNYALTVTNTVGSASGSFEIDVEYPPEATSVGGSEIVITGSTISLTAFQSTIGGNPVPTISWAGPNGLPRNTSGRFNTSVPGQITVMDIMTDDNGTYTCTISNQIGQDQSHTVHIVVAVPASPPQQLIGRDVTDTTINLTWSPPDYLGLPELSFYKLKLTPSPPSDVNLTTTSISLLVYGIIPNTQYNVTVVGVSTGDNFDVLEGQESNQITFNTATGAPMFYSVTAAPLNGTIEIQWTFRHTGGLSIDVYSYCEVDELGVDSRLVSLQLCDHEDCFTQGDLVGSTTIDFVQSGKEYSCTVTAVNSEGTDRRSVSSVLSNKGLPSTPIIFSSVVLPGRLTLTLTFQFAGAVDGSFRIIVEIIDANSGRLFRVDNFLFPNYTDDDKVSIIIDIVEGGSFTFVVIAENSFGHSVENALVNKVLIRRDATSSRLDSIKMESSLAMSQNFIGSCTPTMLEGEMAVLSGGLVGGIIVAVIAMLVIIGLVTISVIFIIFKNKGSKQVKSTVSNRDLNLPPTTEYEVIAKRCEQPDPLNNIGVEQNIAYGEVKPPIYL